MILDSEARLPTPESRVPSPDGLFAFGRGCVISCMEEAVNGVRMDWAETVTTRCQYAVTDLRAIDVSSFRRRFDRLADDLPPAETEGERVFLHNLLRTFADVGGRHFHTVFHRRSPYQPCEGHSLTRGMAVWKACAAAADPRCTLREWARGFEAAFDKEHSVEPSLGAWRARAAVQPLDLDALATALGCRRVELTQSFRRGFRAGRLSTAYADISAATKALYSEADRLGSAGERQRLGPRDHLASGLDLPRIIH